MLRALALPRLRTLELLPLSTSNLDLADPAVQEAWLALFRNCPRLGNGQIQRGLPAVKNDKVVAQTMHFQEGANVMGA